MLSSDMSLAQDTGEEAPDKSILSNFTARHEKIIKGKTGVSLSFFMIKLRRYFTCICNSNVTKGSLYSGKPLNSTWVNASRRYNKGAGREDSVAPSNSAREVPREST